jgi:sugar/nucleoside kinase (ribokinase family)
VDVLKPNVSELAELLRTLMEGSYGTFSSSAPTDGARNMKQHRQQLGRGQESEYGQYIRNRTAVSRSLDSVYKALKDDDTGVADLVDVRVLAHALVGVLAGAAQGSAPDATSEGRPRLIRHKHVVVSMGKHGVLWAAQTAAFNKIKTGRTAAHRDVLAQSADGLVSSLHVACEPLPPGASVNTNGGGDAFCAGFIAGVFAEGGVTVAAIERGHAAARKQCLKF